MESKETIKIREDKMVQVEVDGKTYTVNKAIHHFIEILKLWDRDIDINEVISQFSSFVSHWDIFRQMKKDESILDNDENLKHLPRLIIGHTIKPRTQYSNQQEKVKGRNRIYPVTRIRDEETIESMAMGGNYPIADCNFYALMDNKFWIKLKQ